MKYALLVYTNGEEFQSMSAEEREAISREYFAIRDEPGCYDGAHLQPAETATTVRVQDGETLTTDGPFADTKEVFGGYYLFELDNLDSALAVAARVPAARFGGSVEVRPVAE
jgi:hypothetical protein